MTILLQRMKPDRGARSGDYQHTLHYYVLQTTGRKPVLYIIVYYLYCIIYIYIVYYLPIP
jgi:hypothetical protein